MKLGKCRISRELWERQTPTVIKLFRETKHAILTDHAYTVTAESELFYDITDTDIIPEYVLRCKERFVGAAFVMEVTAELLTAPEL